MTELITLAIDGQSATVAAGTTVIAAMAILQAENDAADRAPGSQASVGATVTRRSVTGMLRGPVCGMGVCQECRVTIDGRAHQLACQTLCASDMRVLTALWEGPA